MRYARTWRDSGERQWLRIPAPVNPVNIEHYIQHGFAYRDNFSDGCLVYNPPPRDSMNYPGEVPEWLNGLDSKSSDPLTGPRVRIPPSPPVFTQKFLAHFRFWVDGRNRVAISDSERALTR